MATIKSSTGIYHVVLGAASSKGLFCERKDYKKFMDVVRMYKASHGIKLLGYSLSPLVTHLILHDRGGHLLMFLREIKSTYSVHYQHCYFEKRVFHHVDKVRSVESYDAFVNLYRYIHKQGLNSLIRFKGYEDRKKDEYLDGDYVLSALGAKREQAKDELLKISEEPSPGYYRIHMKDMEYFREEKKVIRVRRAEEFMEKFLETNQISYSELMDDNHFYKKLELIKAFRDKTDLSYRDIGSILDLSHTSVIRLWKMAHERDLVSSLS